MIKFSKKRRLQLDHTGTCPYCEKETKKNALQSDVQPDCINTNTLTGCIKQEAKPARRSSRKERSTVFRIAAILLCYIVFISGTACVLFYSDILGAPFHSIFLDKNELNQEIITNNLYTDTSIYENNNESENILNFNSDHDLFLITNNSENQVYKRQESLKNNLANDPLTAYKKHISKFEDAYYMIHDMDGNGIPELIIRSGTSEADSTFDFYSYNNGIVFCGTVGAGHSHLAIPNDGSGLLLCYQQMGYSSRWLLTLENYKIKEAIVFDGKEADETERLNFLQEYEGSEANVCVGKCGDNCAWYFDYKSNFRGTLTIVGKGEIPNYQYTGDCPTNADTPWKSNRKFITEVIVEQGVASVGSCAFAETNVESVTIPASVVKIEKNAFDWCYNLKNVYFLGTKAQWQTIDIADGNNCLLDAEIHYNSNTTTVFDHPYIPAILNAIAEPNESGWRGSGALYDIDGNGIEELIMIHSVDMKSDDGYECETAVCSVYSISNGAAIQLIDKEFLYLYAGVPSGGVTVVKRDSKIYLAITGENGENYEGSGHWKLYKVNGVSAELDTIVEYDYCFSEHSDYKSGTATINGKACSYKEYEEWVSGFSEVFNFGYENTMRLDDLLAYLKENPSEEPPCSHKWGAWEVTMPATPATVGLQTRTCTVCGEKETNTIPMQGFEDVTPNRYYYSAVMWAVKKCITTGEDETHFAPNADCTRAQAVMFLWNAAGCPEVSKNVKNPFSDVKESRYYYKAVLWAISEGITDGTDATHFSPNGKLNRATFVTFLWRVNGSKSVPVTNNFTDVKSDKFYAKAVAWAVANGITDGITATTFAPNNLCTRAQVVTFVHRAYK